jgi:hypothetical protein
MPALRTQQRDSARGGGGVRAGGRRGRRAGGSQQKTGDEVPPRSLEKARDRPTARYHRTPGDWESFACQCGHLLQLADFSASQMKCPNCGTITRISNHSPAKSL